LPEDEDDAFVELFEETRYSDHPTRPVHRTEAIQRLHRILERLDTVTGGGSR
jgi:hypothetical protein